MVSSWRMSEARTLASESAPDSSTRPRAGLAVAEGEGDGDAAAATVDFDITEVNRGLIASRPSCFPSFAAVLPEVDADAPPLRRAEPVLVAGGGADASPEKAGNWLSATFF